MGLMRWRSGAESATEKMEQSALGCLVSERQKESGNRAYSKLAQPRRSLQHAHSCRNGLLVVAFEFVVLLPKRANA